MNYFFKQKFNVGELVDFPQQNWSRIVIFEEEEYLAGIYAQYLKLADFLVQHCWKTEDLLKDLALHKPHLLVLGTKSALPVDNLVWLLAKLKHYFPYMPVVTIGYNIEPEALKSVIAGGVAGHIDRRLSRPQDIVTVVKSILHSDFNS